MITWMQHHKKWLIITIWISTIAFVGAGFVGWGSYNYGKSDKAVAVVGDKEVPLGDLQSEYNVLYSQYQQMLGGEFNQELAEQLNLEQIALQRVIQKYLFLNYAEELGLVATDVEVAKELLTIPSFLKDGKFDKDTYVSVLKQNRKTIAEFEELLKQDLLVRKVQAIFDIPLSQNEINNIGSLLFTQNKVTIKILNDSLIKITPTKEELQSYWEKVKEDYKSPLGYEISYTKVENKDNIPIKEMQKVALREYLDLKKEESKFQNSMTLFESSDLFSKESLDQIFKAQEGEILKPILENNLYYVVRLDKKIEPKVLPFEEVMTQVNKRYITQEKNRLLEKKAQEQLANFQGETLETLSRASVPDIKGLSKEEESELAEAIFGSSTKESYLNLGTKVVLFRIEKSTIPAFDTENTQLVVSSLQGAKTNALTSALLEKLQNKYSVRSYLSE